MLVLLEKLSPAQRAAYVLREAFDYPYDQIAEIVQLSEANVRQLVSRSRKRIAKVIAAFAGTFWTGSTLAFAETNGNWSAVASRDGEVFVVISISASADGIDQVQWMLNPEKLATLSFS